MGESRDPRVIDPPANESERIVVAFVELVVERGYQQVSMEAVADRAAVGLDVVGHYFDSPPACFTAAWDRLERIYLERLAAAYRSVEGWANQLRAAAVETVLTIVANPTEANFIVVESLTVGPEGRLRHQALGRRLATLLDRVRAQLEDPSSVPSTTANWVVGIFFDRIYRYVSTGRQDELAGDIPELMFLARSAYFGPESGLAELRMKGPGGDPI